jgi:hypothetical protein
MFFLRATPYKTTVIGTGPSTEWSRLGGSRRGEYGTAAGPPEQALIEALKARYPRATALDASNLDPVLRAYAAEMRAVAERFPGDSDIQTMYAESMMNVNAWKLWSRDGTPAGGRVSRRPAPES